MIDRGLNGATDPVVATSVAVLELLTSRMVGLYFAGAMGGRVHGPVRRLGGDKRDRWAAWYEQAIPEADGLYDEHLAELRDEGEQS